MIAATQSNLLRVGDPKENGTPTLVMRLNKKELFLGVLSPKKRSRRFLREKRMFAFYAELRRGKAILMG